jgi:hypothetical protein
VIAYAGITLLIAFLMTFIRGAAPPEKKNPGVHEYEPQNETAH